ncbi:prolyl oligopeptidase family serine peptidase [bacterium]|nr:prolyl oligopeptidase family serine peptidase [bacterium]
MGCSTTGRKPNHAAGEQTPYMLKTKIPVKIGYQLFLPKGYDAHGNKKWPLIFFLHGAGERGKDLEQVKKHGPPKLVQNDPHFPFVVVSPQCPKGRWWNTTELITLLDEIVGKYRIDENRIYLTGLSMGGFGTWRLALEHPNRFAAIAPICGGGQLFRVKRNLKNIPIWVFHGAKDSVVPVSESRRLVAALKEQGADVRYTEYPDANHDSWTESYANPKLYQWFLSHTLNERQ